MSNAGRAAAGGRGARTEAGRVARQTIKIKFMLPNGFGFLRRAHGHRMDDVTGVGAGRVRCPTSACFLLYHQGPVQTRLGASGVRRSRSGKQWSFAERRGRDLDTEVVAPEASGGTGVFTSDWGTGS